MCCVDKKKPEIKPGVIPKISLNFRLIASLSLLPPGNAQQFNNKITKKKYKFIKDLRNFSILFLGFILNILFGTG